MMTQHALDCRVVVTNPGTFSYKAPKFGAHMEPEPISLFVLACSLCDFFVFRSNLSGAELEHAQESIIDHH